MVARSRFSLMLASCSLVFFFSSRRRHTRWNCDWSSDVCSSDLVAFLGLGTRLPSMVIGVGAGFASSRRSAEDCAIVLLLYLQFMLLSPGVKTWIKKQALHLGIASQL